MPFRSQAQNRYFRWAEAHPADAAHRGLKPSVVHDFIQASHGERVRDLPQHVERKAEGGAVVGRPYPPPMRW